MTEPMNPGSDEARRNGCKCDATSNKAGAGIATFGGVSVFKISSACPLHATTDGPMPRDPETMDLFGGAT